MGELKKYNPTLCLTHNCNLNCVYCYQQHDKRTVMTLDTAKKVIDDVLVSVPVDRNGIIFSLIGGEPLLEFKLIKDIYDYAIDKKTDKEISFFATTNGTVLTDEMKKWFSEHNDTFILGLSMDGDRDTHNHNRSNSFDKIDRDFFINNWPNQGVKMTLSDYSMYHFADDVIALHNMGFKSVRGVNFDEQDFTSSKEKYVSILVPQLQKLACFYSDNRYYNQAFARRIDICAHTKREPRKWCGTGVYTPFYDCDGKKYPCPYLTPMTISEEQIDYLEKIDFNDVNVFTNAECLESCYLYPICSTCAGANLKANGKLSDYNKSKCVLTRLFAVFTAEFHAQRILKHPELYSDERRLYYTIQAIEDIRERYLAEFAIYL